MSDYDGLQAAAERPPKKVTDHAAAWQRLEPVGTCNSTTQERIEKFCAEKRITIAALEQLGTRVKVDRNGGVELAFGYPAGGAITAVKLRPLGDKPRYALEPSTFVEPLVVGNRASLDWFIAEGETDTARLWGLVGDAAAILCLPAGAKAFKPEWGARVPRGAVVHLCHDNDEAGDEGAAKAAAVLGGRVVRVRPPDGCKDWCDWVGGRDEFVQLVAAARAGRAELEFQPLQDFAVRDYPPAEPLLGDERGIYLALGSLLLLYGAEGSGKSTLTIDAVAHLAAGIDWLGIAVPRPVRVLLLENEGPPGLFQRKLTAKAASFPADLGWTANVHVYASPWGEFSFANADSRAALNAYCDEHEIELVCCNPTLGLGVAGSGRPDETQRFVDWLVECGLKARRAFWLLHHENKAGQISGDWGRHPDTKAQLQADGNRPRTKLVWEKTRWATLPAEGRPKSCLLEWVVESEGYSVVELDTVGVSDGELRTRVDDYLAAHPWSSTTTIETEVTGNAKRIRAVLEDGDYDSAKGPRGAILWNHAPDPVLGSEDGRTG
jgi:hypothetical protein